MRDDDVLIKYFNILFGDRLLAKKKAGPRLLSSLGCENILRRKLPYPPIIINKE